MASHILNIHTTEMPSRIYKGVLSANFVTGAVFAKIRCNLNYMYLSVQVVTKTTNKCFISFDIFI